MYNVLMARKHKKRWAVAWYVRAPGFHDESIDLFGRCEWMPAGKYSVEKFVNMIDAARRAIQSRYVNRHYWGFHYPIGKGPPKRIVQWTICEQPGDYV